ncbi:MAG: radical SAM protein [Deltaproteobacteria bacterium]|nr:radical SAM protein [Nannocystaceae bacterium]
MVTAAQPELPQMVCLRVTRACNARCAFCLAPPDGAHPGADELERRIDWLLARGVRTIHFCGGEPTIHPALAGLVAYTRSRGAKSKLTTNAIAIPEALVPVLRAAGTEVKVSVHGDRAHHDRVVGRAAYDRTVANLTRLVAAGIATSVQTTVLAGSTETLDTVTALCLELHVRRLSVLPFIPRGHGRDHRDGSLASTERRALRDRVKQLRRTHAGRLDVRWLDFASQPFHVLEADGRLVLECATEAFDRLLARV